MELQDLFLTFVGLITGFVDAIAGGGGLISLPSIILTLGPGPLAIGTNKVAGTLAAVIALVVYARKGHLDLNRSVTFSLWVGVGAFSGSWISPLLPVWIFRWILIVTCPLILWVVWRKDLWVQKELKEHSHQVRKRWFLDWHILLPGLACGFYDGVWGPGGGTFMFLSLLFFAKLPLLTALAASKMANTASAGVALISYGARGYVSWKVGALIALGIAVGSFFGAQHATKNASRIVRPVLAFVVALLVFRLLR